MEVGGGDKLWVSSPGMLGVCFHAGWAGRRFVPPAHGDFRAAFLLLAFAAGAAGLALGKFPPTMVPPHSLKPWSPGPPVSMPRRSETSSALLVGRWAKGSHAAPLDCATWW